MQHLCQTWFQIIQRSMQILSFQIFFLPLLSNTPEIWVQSQTLQNCLVWEYFIPDVRQVSWPHFSHVLLFLSEYEQGLQLPPCIGDVLSESYDIMCNEGHVWAVNQGTFSWPGPDHRENILTATPSSFYSSTRCPQKMLTAVLGKSLPLVSVRNSFILTGPRGNSEMKKRSHKKWTPPNGKMNLTFNLLPMLQLQLCKHSLK